MKWYLLKVGFLFVLLAVILDVLDVYIGVFPHRSMTPLVIYLWLAMLALAAGFDFIVEHRHLSTVTSLSPLLDGGQKPEISQGWDGTTLVTSIAGQYRGRLMGAEMRGYYSQRYARISIAITLACKWPWTFEIKRRTMGTQLMGAFGEVFTPIGEPELDEELAISGDDPSGLRRWLSRLEIRQSVRQLTLEHHAKLSTVTAQLSIPSLQCSYSPYHWYYRPHLPAVLEIMSPLAASLENRAESVGH
jgi:hypothetical protein